MAASPDSATRTYLDPISSDQQKQRVKAARPLPIRRATIKIRRSHHLPHDQQGQQSEPHHSNEQASTTAITGDSFFFSNGALPSSKIHNSPIRFSNPFSKS
ncbi:hypothetical protein ACLOJK_029264, partial [Asimina triloba]